MPFLSDLRAMILAGIAALCLLVAVVQTVRLHGFLWIDGALDRLAECEKGRATDRSKYEQAQRDAQAKNRADVERIKAEQEKISAEQKSKYERDLARLRAGGVRKELAPAPGSPGPTGTPGVPQSACRADEQNVCVPRSIIMRAAEIELGRNALIDWINAQRGVKR
jgi:hypothetical protein